MNPSELHDIIPPRHFPYVPSTSDWWLVLGAIILFGALLCLPYFLGDRVFGSSKASRLAAQALRSALAGINDAAALASTASLIVRRFLGTSYGFPAANLAPKELQAWLGQNPQTAQLVPKLMALETMRFGNQSEIVEVREHVKSLVVWIENFNRTKAKK